MNRPTRHIQAQVWGAIMHAQLEGSPFCWLPIPHCYPIPNQLELPL